MISPIVLVTQKDKCTNDAMEVLSGAMALDIESVVIFVKLRDGRVLLEKSMHIDTPALIAALEMAKMQAYDAWKNQE